MKTSDIEVAIGWLDVNEGDNGEAAACRRVADYLHSLFERRLEDRAIRAVARQAGVPLQDARRALKRVRAGK